MARSLFEPFSLFHLSMFCEAVSLARLVKAEIVSPIYGILINTDVGNPTAPFITALGRYDSYILGKSRTATRRTPDIHPLYKGTRLFSFFPPVLNRILPPPRVPTPQAQVRRFGPSTMSGSNLQGRWMPSSVTEEDIKKLR